MTVVLKKQSTLAACVLIVFLHFSPPVLSLTFKAKPHSALQVEGRPFELVCYIKGTPDEIKDHKILWEGHDINEDKIIPIKGNDNNGIITVDKTETSITSTLKLAGPPKFKYKITIPFSYTCKMIPSPDNLQANLPIYSIKADVVPQIRPQELKPAAFKENVEVNCTVSYNNTDNNLPLFLILSLLKDGKYLVNKSFPYRKSNQAETIKHTVKVESFRDGGNYVCNWTLKFERNRISGIDTMSLSILPYLNGPKKKEVKEEAGSDVKLTCDVVGFPIKYKWENEEGVEFPANDSRIKPVNNILYIHNINYEDRKKYTCIGLIANDIANKPVTQVIILRVKDPLAPLWPFIGIVIEAILVAAIILLSELYKKQKQNENDGIEKKVEITDQPSTSQT